VHGWLATLHASPPYASLFDLITLANGAEPPYRPSARQDPGCDDRSPLSDFESISEVETRFLQTALDLVEIVDFKAEVVDAFLLVLAL
jgi:hypothetical protein